VASSVDTHTRLRRELTATLSQDLLGTQAITQQTAGCAARVPPPSGSAPAELQLCKRLAGLFYCRWHCACLQAALASHPFLTSGRVRSAVQEAAAFATRCTLIRCNTATSGGEARLAANTHKHRWLNITCMTHLSEGAERCTKEAAAFATRCTLTWCTSSTSGGDARQAANWWSCSESCSGAERRSGACAKGES
jgi:hypothetical protein